MTERKRLLVTGAHGFVAGSVLAQAGPAWETHALSRGAALLEREGLVWHQGDPLAFDWLAPLFSAARPAAVIHTAALADIDYCQAHPEHADTVNIELTRRLAELCADAGAKLVFCSTDTVFDGEHAPYREEDRPEPVNHYAETKVAAEQVVGAGRSPMVIARLALVIGLPVLGAGNSFLARFLAALREGRTMAMSPLEARTPVDVITTGRALLELAAGDHCGVFHLAGNSRVSRLELAQRIAARFGFPPDRVVAQAAGDYAPRARRPRDVSLDNRKVRAALATPMLTLEDGLSLILETAHTAPREHAGD